MKTHDLIAIVIAGVLTGIVFVATAGMNLSTLALAALCLMFPLGTFLIVRRLLKPGSSKT